MFFCGTRVGRLRRRGKRSSSSPARGGQGARAGATSTSARDPSGRHGTRQTQGDGALPGADPLDEFRRALGAGATSFLSPSEERAAAARDAARALFSRLSTSVAAEGVDLPFPELHTEGLDVEQVWMQIEMQLEPLLGKAKTALKRLRPAMQEGDAMRADRLLQLPESTAGEDDDEAPQWEPFREGVEYDVASDDEDADSDDEEAVEAADGDAGGGREGEGDLTAKFFKNPGMFNLTEMENFSLQAEEEEFERARLEERRAAKRAAGGADDDEDEDDDSEEENPLYAASDDEGSDASDSDASDSDASDSDSEDDMADLLGHTAKLAGTEAPSRASKRGAKAASKKKGKEIMFEDFFGPAPAGARLDAARLPTRTSAATGKKTCSTRSNAARWKATRRIPTMKATTTRRGASTNSARTRVTSTTTTTTTPCAKSSSANSRRNSPRTRTKTRMGLSKRRRLRRRLWRRRRDATRARASAPSAFQRAQDKLARQINTLEERALQEKTWLLKGEASAKERPKNSVLEADLEFDHVQAPPPVVSEEMTAKLEDIIKARIAEQRFDDVERVEPGLDDDRRRKTLPELDDTKSKKGLGDIYADEFVKQRAAAEGRASGLEEKEDPLVVEAKSLFKALTTKLDALSHFHFAPKPVMEEMAVKVDAPALEAEEVAPAMASDASRKAPEEIFAGGENQGGVRGSAAGDVKSEGELSKEERKAARAKRKRKAKAVGEERERVKAKRARAAEAKEKAAEEAGFTRKAPKVSMLAAAPAGGRSKSEFAKSSKVFGMLQEAKEADGAGLGGKTTSKSDGMKNRAALKL